MLKIDGLYKAYGRTHILTGLDLEIQEGQHTLVLGPSGAGKSTLMNLVARLLDPDRGTITLDGRPYDQWGDPAAFRIENIGMVFQEIHLIESLTARQNIEMVQLAAPAGRTPISPLELLEPLGVAPLLGRRASLLSRGERQRVALARAFANSPRLVLADEPTASLDPSNRHRTLDHLFDLASRVGATVLIVSHDPEIVGREELGQRLLLEGGQFVRA